MPLVRPVIGVECDVPFVTLKVFVIAAYATPAVVLYRQVAVSFVVRLSVVCVVPTGSDPAGSPFERTGGVVSVGGGAPTGVIMSVWISVDVNARL